MISMLDTQQIIERLLRSMGLSWKTIEVSKGFFDQELVYNIKGGNSFLLTKGRFSDGLPALNHLVHVIIEKQTGEYKTDVSLDIDNHRGNHIVSLCEEVDALIPSLSSGNEHIYRPLTAFERKVVHQHVQNTYPHITTVSEGEGLERRLKLLLTVN